MPKRIYIELPDLQARLALIKKLLNQVSHKISKQD